MLSLLRNPVSRNLFLNYDVLLLSLNAHIVQVDVLGPGDEQNQFTVKTVRRNPAGYGAVTGNATYASFLCSMLGKNLHF